MNSYMSQLWTHLTSFFFCSGTTHTLPKSPNHQCYRRGKNPGHFCGEGGASPLSLGLSLKGCIYQMENRSLEPLKSRSQFFSVFGRNWSQNFLGDDSFLVPNPHVDSPIPTYSVIEVTQLKFPHGSFLFSLVSSGKLHHIYNVKS